MEQSIIAAILMIIGLGAGTFLERRHFKSLDRREAAMAAFPATTLRRTPKDWLASEPQLITESIVVSTDYFKRFIASVLQLFGGRIFVYESLMERGRREALMRLKETARNQGCDALINVRYETSRLASSTYGGKGTTGVEVLAFGTGLRLGNPDILKP